MTGPQQDRARVQARAQRRGWRPADAAGRAEGQNGLSGAGTWPGHRGSEPSSWEQSQRPGMSRRGQDVHCKAHLKDGASRSAAPPTEPLIQSLVCWQPTAARTRRGIHTHTGTGVCGGPLCWCPAHRGCPGRGMDYPLHPMGGRGEPDLASRCQRLWGRKIRPVLLDLARWPCPDPAGAPSRPACLVPQRPNSKGFSCHRTSLLGGKSSPKGGSEGLRGLCLPSPRCLPGPQASALQWVLPPAARVGCMGWDTC